MHNSISKKLQNSPASPFIRNLPTRKLTEALPEEEEEVLQNIYGLKSTKFSDKKPRSSTTTKNEIQLWKKNQEIKTSGSPKNRTGFPKRKNTVHRPKVHTWTEGAAILKNNSTLSYEQKKVMIKLVRIEVPEDQRRRLWLVSSGAEQAMKNNPNYYNNLINNFIPYPSPSYHQIELDIDRTFPEDKYFRQSNTKDALRNVLFAYNRRNPTVGYCQGLNFIAGRLLKYMSQEEAFWSLAMIIESILPVDYFTVMVGVLLDQKIFADLIHKHLPVMVQHFNKMHMDPALVSLQWFVCLYSYNLPFTASDRVWDLFFLEGSSILFKAGLAILFMLEKTIIKCKDISELFNKMDKGPKNLNDINAFVQTMQLKKFEITEEYLEYERDTKRSQIYKEMKDQEISKNKLFKHQESKTKYMNRLYLLCGTIQSSGEVGGYSGKIKCNSEWPICAYDHSYKDRYASYFCYRVGYQVEIIENYFESAVLKNDIVSPLNRFLPGDPSPKLSLEDLTKIVDNQQYNLFPIPKYENKEAEEDIFPLQKSKYEEEFKKAMKSNKNLITPRKGSNLGIISKESGEEGGGKQPEAYIQEEYYTYHTLLIERNRHLCGNNRFVKRVEHLIRSKEGKYEAIFETPFLDIQIKEETNIEVQTTMDKYIDHILHSQLDSSFDEEIKSGEEKLLDPVAKRKRTTGHVELSKVVNLFEEEDDNLNTINKLKEFPAIKTREELELQGSQSFTDGCGDEMLVGNEFESRKEELDFILARASVSLYGSLGRKWVAGPHSKSEEEDFRGVMEAKTAHL